MVIVALVALAWGGLAAAATAALAGRRIAAARARTLGRRRPRRRVLAARRLVAPAVARARTSVIGRVAGGLARAWAARREHGRATRDLPVAVDLVGVAVGAGCTPWQAVELTARFAPAAVAAPFERALRATALGASFDDALAAAAAHTPDVAPLADVLRATACLGAPIGPALARLAGEVRATVRRQAEARARTVPVRLLFPLVFCALPAFALLTVVPVVLEGLRF